MKVLYLTNIPVPYRVAFFNELGKLCDLTVLYEQKYADDRDQRWLEEKKLTYQSHYLPGIKVGADSGFNPGVVRWLSRQKYDAIIVGGYSTPTGILSILYMRLFRVRYIVNVDGGIIRNDDMLKHFIKRFLLGRASAYLTTGHRSMLYLKHYGVSAPIHLYPFTSISKKDLLDKPVSKQEKIKIRTDLNISDEKMIVSVGQLIPRKGFDILIQAMKYIDQSVSLYIIGGEPIPEYIRLVEQLELRNIHFVPFSTKESLRQYYMAADLFVLPTREDIWGLVVNEAMAHALPVITTQNCLAGCELIEHGKTGYLVPSESVECLADHISVLMDSPEIREDMSWRSLKEIAGFTIEEMASRHHQIISECCK